MMLFTQDSVEKVLKEIQSRIPKAFLKGVVETKPLTPNMAMIVDKALEDPDYPADKKRQLLELKEKGEFSRQTVTQNMTMARKIDNFVNREIKKAVKEGRLPTKKQLKVLQAQWQLEKQKQKGK